METITLPKTKYEILEKKAKLYSWLLQKEEKRFPIEIYSAKRIREFLKEDGLNIKAQNRFKAIFRGK